jgi:hypothetical protein
MKLRPQRDDKSAPRERRPLVAPFGLRPGAPPSEAHLGPVRAGALVAVLVVVALALLVLPQVLRLARAAHPIWVADLTGQGSGTYLSASGGYYKLHPYPELPSFPRTSATVAPTVTVVMRARGPVRLQQYQIAVFHSDAEVAVSVRRLGRSTLELRPEHNLAPGRYFVQLPANSAGDDPTFFYFQVTATAPGGPTPTPAPSDTATPTPAPSDTATPTPAPSDTATPTPAPSDTATPTPATGAAAQPPVP